MAVTGLPSNASLHNSSPHPLSSCLSGAGLQIPKAGENHTVQKHPIPGSDHQLFPVTVTSFPGSTNLQMEPHKETRRSCSLISPSAKPSTPAPSSPRHSTACPHLPWDEPVTGDVNAKPGLDPDIPTPLPTLALCPREGGWCQFWPKPRLLPGEAAMTLTFIKQQLASLGVAKAMPTSAASTKNKGNTQE